MKKFIALLMALVMAMSLATVAWGADVTLTGNEAATANNAVAISGSNCEYAVALEAGNTFNGAGYTYTVTGSDPAKEDVAIYLNGSAVIKNVTIDCVGRGIDTDVSAVTSVTVDNVKILNSARAMHIQAPATLNVSNSVLGGKISYVLTGAATFTNCTFVKNGVYEDCVEPWSATTFVNCDFEEGYKVSFEDFPASGATVTLQDCTYAGAPLTADNMAAMFSNYDASDLALVTTTHVADGYTKQFSNVYAKGTGAGATISPVNLYYFKAVAPVYSETTGFVTNQPSIAYYLCPELTGATYLVEVTSLGAADVVVYNDIDGKALFKYLDVVDNVEYEGNGIPFNNFGKACGQYKDANYDKTATYYSFENAVYKAVETSATALMVNGKVVPVESATGAFVEHIASYTYNDKFEVTAVKCGVCGKVATIVPNHASLPTGVTGYGPINTSMYYYWPAAVVTPSTDKVESADTFDAGIAMYVGMSVMAAAGGAVVIGKKKD